MPDKSPHQGLAFGSTTLKPSMMFGALVQDQENELLTFVENNDLESALSRNRRNKPHISCEACRIRKARCSGQSPSCDRCTASGSPCTYPARKARRKKSTTALKTDTSESSSDSNSSSRHQSVSGGHHRGSRGCKDELPMLGPKDKHSFDDDLDLSHYTMNFHRDQHLAENWLSSLEYSGGIPRDGSMSVDDAWMDMDAFVFKDTGDHMQFADQRGHLDADSMLDPIFSESMMVSHGAVPLESRDGSDSYGYAAGSSDSMESPTQLPPLDLSSHMSFLDKWTSSASPSTASNKSQGRGGRESSKSSSAGSRSRTQKSSGRCNCLHLTACLLEELGSKSASSGAAATDVLLSYFRETLTRCNTIIECERCTAAAENDMLLAISGRYMSTICEHIVTSYVITQRKYGERRHSAQSSTSRKGSVNRPRGVERSSDPISRGEDDDMWFSTYRIESTFERLQVLQCIISVQIAEFRRLLETLKERAGDRQGHLMLLTEAEMRTKRAKSMLKQSMQNFSGAM